MAKLINIKKVTNADEAAGYEIPDYKDISKYEFVEVNAEGNDLISKQAAIDLFPNDALEWDTYYGYIAPHFARRMIEELPSAQRTGKWVDGHCSICGCDVPAYIIDWKWQKDMNARFCPMCGARMDEE